MEFKTDTFRHGLQTFKNTARDVINYTGDRIGKAGDQVVKYSGRVIRWMRIQVQDPLVAYSSLVVANLIIYEIFFRLIKKANETINGRQDNPLLNLSAWTLFLTAYAAGTVGFAKLVKLSLNNKEIVAISASILIARIAIGALPCNSQTTA